VGRTGCRGRCRPAPAGSRPGYVATVPTSRRRGPLGAVMGHPLPDRGQATWPRAHAATPGRAALNNAGAATGQSPRIAAGRLTTSRRRNLWPQTRLPPVNAARANGGTRGWQPLPDRGPAATSPTSRRRGIPLCGRRWWHHLPDRGRAVTLTGRTASIRSNVARCGPFRPGWGSG
jgi:hypothetical protein